MIQYGIKRLAAIVLLAFGISVLVFLIIRLIPGDPAAVLLGTNAGDGALVARLRQELGLDQALPVQYYDWISKALRGNFGYSYSQQRPVTSLLAESFPPTLELMAAGLGLSVIFGALLGVAAAIKRNSKLDTAAMGIALIGVSMPSFWLGLMLILLFAVKLHWFEVIGGTSLKGLVLPAVTLAMGSLGFNARFVRSSVINILAQKHVVTARAKGISWIRVQTRHVLRNALPPIVTIVGIQIGQLLSGVVIIEIVFSRPGIGQLLVQSILSKDYLTVQAVVLIITVLYAVTNLAVDLLYPFLDPRVATQ